MRYDNILRTIGNTPVVRINRLFGPSANVWMKLERANPGGSIKDRVALSMIEDAEKQGILHPDSVIIEPTSGNTGIGLAMAAAVKGYRMILVMPESMSVERRKLIGAYGAEVVLTPKEKGMKGSIERAEELAASLPSAWIPSQFDNPANPRVHQFSTALEIAEDFPDGIDYFVSGVGTGGNFSGISRVLKERFPKIGCVAVEPVASPVISGGKPGPHPLQGIGAGFIPKNLDTGLIDRVITISGEEAYRYAREAANREGILCGISSGASLAAVAKLLEYIPAGATVLTMNYDTGERYLSVESLY